MIDKRFLRHACSWSLIVVIISFFLGLNEFFFYNILQVKQSFNYSLFIAVKSMFLLFEDIEIRLAGGVLRGRVEVRMPGNKWGTVCDDHFDLRDAHVVCRMLNHTEAVGYFRSATYYPVVSASVNIWLDNLKCRGTENSLMECRHRGWGENNCGHYEDVGVICKNDSILITPNGRLNNQTAIERKF